MCSIRAGVAPLIAPITHTLVRSCSTKCTLFPGRKVADNILSSLRLDIGRIRVSRPPCLCAVSVGSHTASTIYLQRKAYAAKMANITFHQISLPERISQQDLEDIVKQLNDDPDIDGVIIQLPLPSHLSETHVCNSVLPSKDVDGFTASNLGRLVQGGSEGASSLMVPPTALAVKTILSSLLGERPAPPPSLCLVVGRSHNVGLPISLLMSQDRSKGGLGLTTTQAHRDTHHSLLKQLAKHADIIVTATGVPNLLGSESIKPGAVLVDVGLSRVRDEVTGGEKLVGDLCPSVRQVQGATVTPVPGGVGPLTVACLLQNTFKAWKLRRLS